MRTPRSRSGARSIARRIAVRAGLCAFLWVAFAAAARADEYRAEESLCCFGSSGPNPLFEPYPYVLAAGTVLGFGWAAVEGRRPGRRPFRGHARRRARGGVIRLR